ELGLLEEIWETRDVPTLVILEDGEELALPLVGRLVRGLHPAAGPLIGDPPEHVGRAGPPARATPRSCGSFPGRSGAACPRASWARRGRRGRCSSPAPTCATSPRASTGSPTTRPMGAAPGW